jgi:hypothetical protein
VLLRATRQAFDPEAGRNLLRYVRCDVAWQAICSNAWQAKRDEGFQPPLGRDDFVAQVPARPFRAKQDTAARKPVG